MPALEADAERYKALEHDLRLLTRPASDILAWRNGQEISCAQFLADVAHCAETLPDAPYLINLCTDRYRFGVAFFAAAIRGQTTLLPSQRSVESIATLRQTYTPCRVIADNPDTHCDSFVDFAPAQNGALTDLNRAELRISPEHTAAIAFTSGSTGVPSAHPKSWALLCAGRATHARYLCASEGATVALATQSADQSADQQGAALNGLVATVPSWHMYGLEWAMLLPTVAPLKLFCGPDFFPGDVVAALTSFGESSHNVLVSTPVHLRALLKSPPPGGTLTRTLSATAPLNPDTALAVESHLDTRMFEIYGCSEIGSLAVRQEHHQSTDWTFFDIFDLDLNKDQLQVSSPLLEAPVTLADRFGKSTDNRMQLLGRASDLVKVAGKRESLARLNSELLSLPDVTDGVVYQPQALGVPGGERLAAFVVGKNLNPANLRQALASKLDPAFVPRPIRVIDALPRDTTSKLQARALKKLAESFADG